MRIALALAAVTAACLAPVVLDAITRHFRKANATIAAEPQVIGICYGCQTNSSPDWSAFCDTCRPPVSTPIERHPAGKQRMTGGAA
jgi:hypothetical protein